VGLHRPERLGRPPSVHDPVALEHRLSLVAGDAHGRAVDANGNLTTLTDGTQTTNLTWDARDRVIGLEQPGTLASFAYAFGRRLAKTVNGAATQFLYDGLDIAQQLEAQRTTTYLRSLAIDETLGLSNPDGAFFLTADALGSTLAVTDTAGIAVTEYTYDTFGSVSATNPGFPDPFQFTGRENDGLAGLYYYRARYYHPGLARFIAEDPVGLAGGLNFYAYARGNPTRFGDPSGLFNVIAGAGGGAVGIAAGAEASSGFAFNLEQGTVTGFTTTGSGAGPSGGQYGLYAGLGVFAGFILGDPKNVGGPFVNYYFAIPGTNFSLNVYLNENLEFLGGGFSYGPGIGFARTKTNTILYPLIPTSSPGSASVPLHSIKSKAR